MDNKLSKSIDEVFNKELGITYDEYKRLDIYDQQRVMKILREKKSSKINENKDLVMIGYGEYSLVTKIETNRKVKKKVVESKIIKEEVEIKPKNKILSLFKKKSR